HEIELRRNLHPVAPLTCRASFRAALIVLRADGRPREFAGSGEREEPVQAGLESSEYHPEQVVDPAATRRAWAKLLRFRRRRQLPAEVRQEAVDPWDCGLERAQEQVLVLAKHRHFGQV